MKKVIVYTSTSCQYCDTVKSFLTEKGIEFEIKDVSKNSQYRKELMKLGYMSVPITMIDNEKVVGFDEERLVELLNI